MDRVAIETCPTYPGTSLRARAAELRAIASDLEAQADALDRAAQTSGSQALGLTELRSEYGFSRESLRTAADQGLPVHKGPRGRVMAFRADVETWIKSRAWTPASRRAAEPEDEALSRAEAELLSFGGSNTRSSKLISADSDELTEKHDDGGRDSVQLRRVI